MAEIGVYQLIILQTLSILVPQAICFKNTKRIKAECNSDELNEYVLYAPKP